jgi:hypothetical protein
MYILLRKGVALVAHAWHALQLVFGICRSRLAAACVKSWRKPWRYEGTTLLQNEGCRAELGVQCGVVGTATCKPSVRHGMHSRCVKLPAATAAALA